VLNLTVSAGVAPTKAFLYPSGMCQKRSLMCLVVTVAKRPNLD
jgi:hypothetical protein